MWKELTLDQSLTRFFEYSVRVLLSLLIIAILLAVLAGIIFTFYDLRLKVTYIIDTVMVTVLTEVMAFWYRDMEWQKIATVIILVLSLALVRVIAVRFSPRSHRQEL